MAGADYPGRALVSKREREYQADDDLRTLERAEEVRTDPTRHSRAQAHGRKKITAMQRVLKGRTAGRRRSR